MAQTSVAEIETQLEIALRLEYLSAEQFGLLLEKSTTLGKQPYALRNALSKSK